VTDANVVLGRINPDRPIGGKLARLDVEASRRAIDTHLATPLGLSIEQAAEAILQLANAKMAGAIRLVSIEKGHDPAKFSAMPFGGGGALHTGALIKEVGFASALVPRFPVSPLRSAASWPTCGMTGCRRSTDCSTRSMPQRSVPR
jgi:N-methylhydantoinase A